MDGGAYSPRPEEPREGDDDHGTDRSISKIALIVIVVVLTGAFLSIAGLKGPHLRQSGDLNGLRDSLQSAEMSAT